MPAGTLVTDPVPLPAVLTLNVCVSKFSVAVTIRAAFIVTTQVSVPVQPSPLQPLKIDPVLAVAVNVTTVP